MQQAAPDRDDSPNSTFCSAVGLVRIRDGSLLFDAFILVEIHERVGSKFSSSIMANELDFLAELSLDLDDVAFDVAFALRLGTQTEALHAPVGFVDNQKHVPAAANGSLLHGAADIEVM